jgi:hypothetical protein
LISHLLTCLSPACRPSCPISAMLLIPIIPISIAVVGARGMCVSYHILALETLIPICDPAYPLGNPSRPIVHNPGDSLSCSSMRNLDSLPVSDSMAHSHMYALVRSVYPWPRHWLRDRTHLNHRCTSVSYRWETPSYPRSPHESSLHLSRQPYSGEASL